MNCLKELRVAANGVINEAKELPFHANGEAPLIKTPPSPVESESRHIDCYELDDVRAVPRVLEEWPVDIRGVPIRFQSFPR